MLAPHDRKDAELGVTRRAPEDLGRMSIFVRSEIMFGNQFGSDGRFGHFKKLIGYLRIMLLANALGHHTAATSFFSSAAKTLSKIHFPSSLPRSGSQARSGCGINPATLRR